MSFKTIDKTFFQLILSSCSKHAKGIETNMFIEELIEVKSIDQSSKEEINIFRELCQDWIPKNIGWSAQLKMNKERNYCIIIENVNIFPEYNFCLEKLNEKHEFLCKFIGWMIKIYLKKFCYNFNVEYKYLNNDIFIKLIRDSEVAII